MKQTVMMDDDQQIRDALVVAMLGHAGRHGWGESALAMAEEEVIKTLPARAQAMVLSAFSGRSEQVAEHVFDWLNREMIARVTRARDFAKQSVREKISRLIEVRFAILAAHDAGARAWMRYLLPPPRSARALVCAGRAADAIWRAAGDRSTDSNYYTKRGLLLPILAASGVYWLSNPDSDHLGRFIRRAVNAAAKPPPLPPFSLIRDTMERAFLYAGGMKNTSAKTR
ncbi:MAG: COQ9 family protein [Pseudomonadota bacterium]